MTAFALLVSTPVLPWWLIATCALAFAWFAWATYGKCKLTLPQKCTLWSLRMAAFLLLAWMLLLQSFHTKQSQTEKPAVALLLDTSASMEDNPMGADKTRAERAKELMASPAIRSLSDKARLFIFGLGADIQDNPANLVWYPLNPFQVSKAFLREFGANATAHSDYVRKHLHQNDQKGQEHATDLRDTTLAFTSPRSLISQQIAHIAARFRGDKLAAIILLSDGLDHSSERIDASTLGVPFFIPELEEPGEPVHTAQLDFAVGETSYPKRVTVNWKTGITVAVKRLSGPQAATFPVQLMQDGIVLQEEIVAFADKETTRRLSFQLTPTQQGPQLYEIRIAPPGDENSVNNRKELLIEVTDSKQRILYLEGTPRWEFKFLKRSLLAEQNLQLHAFVKFGDGSFISFDETNSGDPMPALTHESLKEYKAIIFGDLTASALSDEEATAVCKFVEDGGALLMLGGVNAYKEDGLAFTKKLSTIMPASYKSGSTMREGRFTVDFTPEGRVLSAFASLAEEGRFPPLLTLWTPVKPGPFTSAYLAAADGTPVLLARQAGQGRSAMILSDSLWRWQMGGTAGEGGKGLYGRFITQLLYWLCPDKQGDLADAPLQVLIADSEVDQHQKVVVGAIGNVGQGGVSCLITTPSNKTLTLPMLSAKLEGEVGLTQPQNGFRCDFTPNEIGTYKLEARSADGTRHASTILLSRFPELEHTGAPINRAYLHELAEKSGGAWVTWSRCANLLDNLVLTPRTLEIVSVRPIWNHWLGLTILMALYCLEWWLRRKWDMV
ncbi:MAG: hypothetical protein IJT83_09175 [Victivallales bacterium]|nr:hypothetical protein [Victivallales bacterium]